MAPQDTGNSLQAETPGDAPRPARKDRWPWIFVLTLLVLIVAFIVQDRFYHGPLPFDRARWDAERVDWHDETRERMADALVEQRALIGKSRVEVTALLGEPPPTDYFRAFDLVYWLGEERGWMSLDSEWLVLRLDAHARVSEAMIVTD